MDKSKPTRAQVARRAGVAESTVSRALNDSQLISPQVRARVKQAARELGYAPNRQAAMFARNRTGTVGMVVPRYSSFPPFSRAYFPTVLNGAVVAGEARGYFVTIVLDHRDTTAEVLARLVTERSVDGLLFTVSPAEYSRYEYLEEQGIPFVLINNYHENMSSVDARPEPGMRQAFRHAWDLGHRRIGYITGDTTFKNGQDRLAVFERLSREFGSIPSTVPGDFSRTSGRRGAETLLDRAKPPTTIMTASDRAAIGVLDYCKSHGIAVPGRVSVIGYDNLHTAADATPPLTTVVNPIEQSGYVGMQTLIDIVEKRPDGPICHWLDTALEVRESTAAGVEGVD
ncbi:MAG: LacI family DNA-binding transcriptional regulator [Alkalispirochaeta sp.]